MYKHLIYSIVTILSSFKLSSFWFKNKWNNSKIYFSIIESQGWWCRRSCLNIQWCSWKQFMWCLTFWHNVMDCNWTWYTSRSQTNNDVCDNSSDVLHGMFSVLLKRHIWKRIAKFPHYMKCLWKKDRRERGTLIPPDPKIKKNSATLYTYQKFFWHAYAQKGVFWIMSIASECY